MKHFPRFGRCAPLLAAAVVCSAAAVPAAEVADSKSPAAAEAPVDFGREILPIFAKRCFACHGPDAAEGGLRLHQQEAATAELDSGAVAIVPGSVDESALLERIAADEESIRMPPEGKPLEAQQIAVIRRWIAQGAPWQAHWAFRPPQPQRPPPVKDHRWVSAPVDAFILAKLEAAGLTPAPPADKVALLRRVSFDLTGLPPTPEEVAAFLADDSPQAYERVVDRLLASPRYGERWARHWLDLVRYAETNSFERDGPKPNAWRYRDYVIESLNQDKPYDQFLREQLAGDALDEATTETIIATGFYRLGIWDDEPADPLQAQFDELDDIMTTTGQVFLGLTINCARCHDHKIDPVPQTDYYRMLAFFRDVTAYGTRGDQQGNNQTDISPSELRAQYAELERQERSLRRSMRVIEQRGIVKMSAPDQRKSETGEREELLKEKLQQFLDEEDWAEYSALKSRLEQTLATRKQLPPREMALSVAKTHSPPPPTHVLLRGNPHVPGDEVQPGFPALFEEDDPTPSKASSSERSASRRRLLADWIASPENRLTARVMANRLWQRHFGRGIVRSANNFGQLGDPPTHPELLDFLAAELIRHDWRLKPMHKMLVMSSAYRMSSQASAEGLAKDPANDLFWRYDMRRLDAEEIRDATLAATGELSLKMHGRSIYPEISREVLAGQSMPGAGWHTSPPAEQTRRSVYIHIKRSLIPTELVNFDFPEPDVSCAVRFATTQPSQALGMLNGDFLNRQAARLAQRLRSEAPGDPRRQVRRALSLALSRAEESQIDRGMELLEGLQRDHRLSPERALDYFCLYVLNLNEFIFLD